MSPVSHGVEAATSVELIALRSDRILGCTGLPNSSYRPFPLERLGYSRLRFRQHVGKIDSMRVLVGLLLLISSPLAVVAADGLSQGDRDYAMSSLHATRKLFLDSTAGMSQEQWNWKASPERWSAAECAEHIAVTEDFITGLVKQILQTPATPEKRIPVADARAKDEKLVASVSDRSTKVNAPEQLRPTHRFKTPADAIAHFKTTRDSNIHYVMITDSDLRAHFAPHPLLGPLDLYQWMLLTSAHTERHTKQLLEVKADPGFPKK